MGIRSDNRGRHGLGKRVGIVGLALAVGLPAAPAAAASTAGFNLRISGSAATGWEFRPAVAYNPANDEFLATWSDTRDESGPRGREVYGQRLSAATGLGVGFNVRISGAVATGDEGMPTVAYNSLDNEYLVAWSDSRDVDARGTDIYGQRVGADGLRRGFNFRISGAAATTSDDYPEVAYNSHDNTYFVVWRDHRNVATRDTDVYGQVVSATGKLVGPNVRISGSAATEEESSPHVAYNSHDNGFLVIWTDRRNWESRGAEVYGQVVAGGGRPVGHNARLSGLAATGHEWVDGVAYNSITNEYLVIWTDTNNSATRGRDIVGQRVSADGTRAGHSFRVSGPTATGTEWWAALAFSPTDNEYLVAWYDDRNKLSRGLDVYAQLVSGTGSLVGFNFRVSGAAATNSEYYPTVAYSSANNQYLVSWADYRDVTTRGSDIYGQRIEP